MKIKLWFYFQSQKIYVKIKKKIVINYLAGYYAIFRSNLQSKPYEK